MRVAHARMKNLGRTYPIIFRTCHRLTFINHRSLFPAISHSRYCKSNEWRRLNSDMLMLYVFYM